MYPCTPFKIAVREGFEPSRGGYPVFLTPETRGHGCLISSPHSVICYLQKLRATCATPNAPLYIL